MGLEGRFLVCPRRKMVLTQPVELPPRGALTREEYAKETLLELFEGMVRDHLLNVCFGEAVEDMQKRTGPSSSVQRRGRPCAPEPSSWPSAAAAPPASWASPVRSSSPTEGRSSSASRKKIRAPWTASWRKERSAPSSPPSQRKSSLAASA